MSVLILPASCLQEIRGSGEATYPEECCGVLVGRESEAGRAVTRVVPAPNEREDSPANRYQIPARFLHRMQGELEGRVEEVVGFFHSHPDVPARPSEYDRTHAWPWYSYLIVSVRAGRALEWRSWRLREDRSGFDPEIIVLKGGSHGHQDLHSDSASTPGGRPRERASGGGDGR